MLIEPHVALAALSYTRGPRDVPLLHETIGANLRGTVERFGEREALVVPERGIDADGWTHTGDLAVMDDDGYLRIVGRIKDMLIRGGENIYPREVEEFLVTIPGVSDAYVIGVPSARRGTPWA